MTKLRIIDEQAGPEEQHKSEVERAIMEGKPVPEEVLKDYPDLTGPKPETNKSEQEPTGTESTGDKGQTNTMDNIDVTKLPDLAYWKI